MTNSMKRRTLLKLLAIGIAWAAMPVNPLQSFRHWSLRL